MTNTALPYPDRATNKYGNYYERANARAVEKARKAAEKASIAGTQLAIADALEGYRVGAMDEAEASIVQVLMNAYRALAEADWNLDVVAPRPNSLKMGRTEYMAANHKRAFYSSITTNDNERNNAETRAMRARGEAVGYGNTPNFVRYTEMCVTSMIQRARQDASASFDAFVAKLAQKNGAGVVSATVDRASVWNDSILTATFEDGSKKVWHTKTIINCSVYGKLFNQWPSREVR